MVNEGGWTPRKSLDAESRRRKAEKIARLLERDRSVRGARVLEIGTGSGVIATCLADLVGPDGGVVSVDVDDLRITMRGYEFCLVEGVELPLPDDDFDVVVTNHTIEHVGGPDDQLRHLREIGRVLRPDGVAYLATPTRWAPVEPHFNVPFLSWLPPGARTPTLRFIRRGTVYDIDPRTRSELLDLVGRAGLTATDVTLDALRATGELEPDGALARMSAVLPSRVLAATRGLLPTMVFVLHHR